MTLLARLTLLLLAGEILGLALGGLAPRVRAALRGWTLFGALLLPLLDAALPRIAFVGIARDGVARALSGATTGPFSTPSWVLVGWIVGTFVFLGISAMGQWRLARAQRSARPVRIAAFRRRLRDLCARRGLRTRVRLRWHAGSRSVPCVVGWKRPAILLPEEARRWPRARLEAVLIHELEHVRHRDVLSRWVAELACCLYWFHPLAWRCASRMRADSEMACDDAVLAAGVRPSRYARDLLTMARLDGPHGLPSTAFSERGSFAERVEAICDPLRPRGGLSRAWGTAIALGVLLSTVGFALLDPMIRARGEPGPAGQATIQARVSTAPGSKPVTRVEVQIPDR